MLLMYKLLLFAYTVLYVCCSLLVVIQIIFFLVLTIVLEECFCLNKVSRYSNIVYLFDVLAWKLHKEWFWVLIKFICQHIEQLGLHSLQKCRVAEYEKCRYIQLAVQWKFCYHCGYQFTSRWWQCYHSKFS